MQHERSECYVNYIPTLYLILLIGQAKLTMQANLVSSLLLIRRFDVLLKCVVRGSRAS